MQKRTVYSLLLLSFILAFAVSSAFGQTVTVESKSAKRCESGVTNISANHSADMSGVEVVLEVSSATGGAYIDGLNVNWQLAADVLNNRIIDLSMADGVSPDTIRIAAFLTDPAYNCLVGTGADDVIATLDFNTNDVCSGEVSISALSYVCENNPTTLIQTQIVECGSSDVTSAAVTAGTITIVNTVPTIADIDDGTVHWGDLIQAQAVGDDGDLVNGCEAISYALVAPPAGMSINATTGLINWTPTGDQVCVHTIEVQVIDACEAVASTTFDICVQNTPPAITCPTEPTNIIWGETASGTVSADDPDGGPAAMLYSLVSFDGTGTFNVNPANGDWSWETAEDNAFCGDFTAFIKVSDGANICDPCSPDNADTCSLVIHVIPTIRVTIEKTHATIQGQMEGVDIFMDEGIECANEMGGYDFLIQYDASALTFMSAVEGQMHTDCGWEYFTYRYGPTACNNGGCPSGIARLVAFAETNNGANHPACFISASGHLATLNFLVTDDRTLECQYVPIRWVWYDCGDNGISSRTGDTLFMSRHVYDYDNPDPIEADAAFPTWLGANSSCDVGGGPGKPEPLRLVDYFNGGVDIVCADSIDARGDINLNGIAYEVADAVLFTNYFVYGLGVFVVNVEGQIAATDCNADGIVLSVADLVTLIRVVVGDEFGIEKLSPVAATVTHDNKSGVLTVDQAVDMGAAYIVAEGDVVPQLLADNMELLYNYDGNNTRIIVSSVAGNTFSGQFITVPGEILSLEMATAAGAPVVSKVIPTEFELAQNYPNPFNPSTNLSFNLPVASDYSLAIYNVNGQLVHTFTGSHDAGKVELVRDASYNASGVYFYKLSAGSFSATKKMVLLK